MRVFLILLSLIICLNVNCKTQKKNSETSNHPKAAQENPKVNKEENQVNTLEGDAKPIPVPVENIDTARLSVSFYSKGEGIDHKSKQRFDMFVNEYEKKIGKILVKQEVRWGREGEVDYCYLLTELSMKEKIDFIKQVQDLFNNVELVHLKENAKCKVWRQNE